LDPSYSEQLISLHKAVKVGCFFIVMMIFFGMVVGHWVTAAKGIKQVMPWTQVTPNLYLCHIER